MRVLLLLDETPASLAARKYAMRLAKETNVTLSGLSGIDVAYIHAPMLGGIGTAAYQTQLEHHLETRARDSRSKLGKDFILECEAHDISCEWLTFDGDPASTIAAAMSTCDLIVTGHDATFHGDVNDPLPNLLTNLLFSMPRPVILCGDKPSDERDILIGYDGSASAARTLQIFALLGFG